MMNPQVTELLQSFETDSKTPKRKYNDDKHISLCKSDKMMNKYKKMRNSVLSYIVANEKSIIKKLSN
jgi:c-di-AMP phosphodiesterase-like protein